MRRVYRPWKDSSARARDAFWRASVLTGAFALVLLVLLFRFSDDPTTLMLSAVVVLGVGGGAGYFWVRFVRHRTGRS
jgi:hypothetical protein